MGSGASAAQEALASASTDEIRSALDELSPAFVEKLRKAAAPDELSPATAEKPKSDVSEAGTTDSATDVCDITTAELERPDLKAVQLEIQMLTGRTVVPCDSFLASAPVTSIKESIHAASGIPVRHQKLIWQTSVLGDDVLLGDLSLPTEGAILHLVISLPPEDQLAQAREIMRQAAAALDVVNVRALSELKTMPTPPQPVLQVLVAVLELRAGIDPAIAVDSRGRVKDLSWKTCKKMLQNPTRFIADLKEFKTLVENGRLPPRNLRAACRIRDSLGPHFSYDAIKATSCAAASLALWVLNILQYSQVCDAVRAEFEGFDIMAEIRDQLAV